MPYESWKKRRTGVSTGVLTELTGVVDAAPDCNVQVPFVIAYPSDPSDPPPLTTIIPLLSVYWAATRSEFMEPVVVHVFAETLYISDERTMIGGMVVGGVLSPLYSLSPLFPPATRIRSLSNTRSE